MARSIHSQVAWCVIRYLNGTAERVREGYKSAATARRSIPFLSKASVVEGGGRDARYAVGRYMIGEAVAIEPFRAYSA